MKCMFTKKSCCYPHTTIWLQRTCKLSTWFSEDSWVSEIQFPFYKNPQSYEQGAAVSDKRRSTSASIRTSHRASAFGSASRRQTVDQETHAHLRKMTIGLNEVKKEEVANKKIEKIVIGGTSTQRILYEFLPTLNIIIQLCVLCNISLLIMPHVESARGTVARNRLSKKCIRCRFPFLIFLSESN